MQREKVWILLFESTSEKAVLPILELGDHESAHAMKFIRLNKTYKRKNIIRE